MGGIKAGMFFFPLFKIETFPPPGDSSFLWFLFRPVASPSVSLVGRSDGVPTLYNPRTDVCCDGRVSKWRPGKTAVINLWQFLLQSFCLISISNIYTSFFFFFSQAIRNPKLAQNRLKRKNSEENWRLRLFISFFKVSLCTKVRWLRIRTVLALVRLLGAPHKVWERRIPVSVSFNQW